MDAIWALRATSRIAWLGCALVLGALAGCGSVRADEALAMLDVTAAAGMPPFTTARFSVAGRPEIAARDVSYDGTGTLKFGYYLPGPSGTLRVTGQALSANCVVGTGTAAVTVQLGQRSDAVPLVIGPVTSVDPACQVAADASADAPADARPADARGDGPRDGAQDTGARTDGSTARPDSGPPACVIATKACTSNTMCCSGLTCGTTSLGQVCCGNFEAPCTRPGGEDCCGQLECINGGCCLPATYSCTGTSCCTGSGLRHHQPRPHLLRQRRRPVHPPRRRRLLRRAPVREQRLREVKTPRTTRLARLALSLTLPRGRGRGSERYASEAPATASYASEDPEKKNAISACAVSAASLPCTAFFSMSVPYFWRIVPSGAFLESVGPITSR